MMLVTSAGQMPMSERATRMAMIMIQGYYTSGRVVPSHEKRLQREFWRESQPARHEY